MNGHATAAARTADMAAAPMMLQSAVSVAAIALVIARAVNILS